MATANRQPVFVLTRSPRAGKRFRAVFPDKNVDFGQEGGQTFIDHQDHMKRVAYLARHGAPAAREDWNNIRTPGALSRWVLWEKPSLQQAVSALGGVLSADI